MGWVAKVGSLLNGASADDIKTATLQGYYTLDTEAQCHVVKVATLADENQLVQWADEYDDDALLYHGLKGGKRKAGNYAMGYKRIN
jgi:hypothetical protein